MSEATLPKLLRYGGDAAFPPFEALDGQGRAQGFQMALLRALARHLDRDLSIELAPWAKTEARFRAGELDLVAMVPTAERRAWARFARGHAAPALAAYHRRGAPDPQGLQDLQDVRLAVLAGPAMRETLRTLMHGLPEPSVQAPDALATLLAVQQGRADVAVLLRAYGDPLLAAGQAPRVVASRLNLGQQTYALAVRPQNAAWLPALQAALDALEADGTLEALRLRWLPSHAALAQAHQLQAGLGRQQQWTWGVAGAATLALGGLGWVLQRRHRQWRAERAARRAAQASLRQAEELLQRCFTRHPEAMLLVKRSGQGEAGRVLDANAAAHLLLGQPAQGLAGGSLATLQALLEPQAWTALVQRLDSEGEIDALPLSLQRSDGSRREVLLNAEEWLLDGQCLVFCLLRDISEQLARDAQLREGFEALRADLLQAQDELAQARASRRRAESALHDHAELLSGGLQLPLRALQADAGLLRARLQAGDAGTALREAQAYSARIERAAERLNGFVSALARYAQQARALRDPPRKELLDMSTLAQTAVALLQAAHPERTAQVRVDPLAPAHGDRDMLGLVWLQLLDNAGKFSQAVPEPRVRVDSHSDAVGTWYRVSDNGAGFDMSRAAGLMLPTMRMPQAAGTAGHGLGLSLVRRIVEWHGGELRLRSSPGVGTVVEFRV